jgi:hypothetical protein
MYYTYLIRKIEKKVGKWVSLCSLLYSRDEEYVLNLNAMIGIIVYEK